MTAVEDLDEFRLEGLPPLESLRMSQTKIESVPLGQAGATAFVEILPGSRQGLHVGKAFGAQLCHPINHRSQGIDSRFVRRDAIHRATARVEHHIDPVVRAPGAGTNDHVVGHRGAGEAGLFEDLRPPLRIVHPRVDLGTVEPHPLAHVRQRHLGRVAASCDRRDLQVAVHPDQRPHVGRKRHILRRLPGVDFFDGRSVAEHEGERR
eukprot:CAMPEP_0183303144 /NCGR_PEP_ID=MMETSP0160_2-20130417/8694_1 /TAXON_ID=2839 ORGANISM="Odontella Sinensis, Strain Grunow 1884" /NCGR_SAMPLE_ID=MMETSP0160_2 /ASSEMBLY_ACC=CAM_ASM_000250 /LENGTH=206 /DNA_ID=CAMNT_0025466009 /DNA_START=420 /DNA_END=1037 /DNA_ORIENTATION=-